MSRTVPLRVVFVVMAMLVAASARADDTVSLSATDFTFTLSRVDASGNPTLLSTDALATYFSLSRCACPTNVLASLTLSSTAAANLGTHTVDAQLMIGSDCDTTTSTTCTAVGAALTFSATQTATSATLGTASVFTAAGRSTCAVASTTSTRLWAIVRLDGARLTSEPSLLLTLGGAGPAAPTAVKTVSADSGLLISWTASGDATTLQGHQVFCSPGPTTPSTAAFDTCGVTTTADGGTGTFSSLDAKYLCSGLVGVGTSSVRVKGLENGQAYEIAVVAVGIDGTPSVPSISATGTPGPTIGFQDLYKEADGKATGCAVAGAERPVGAGLGALVVVVGVALAARRRRGRRGGAGLFVLALVSLGGLRSAHADADEADTATSFRATFEEGPTPPSPRRWNVELRFGPYRPDVDDEFKDRGDSARPYEQLFGTSNHLMSQLEIDRQLVHRAGTWSLGVGVGYYKVTTATLSADLKTRTGDDTSLRLIPLSAALVYRADTLRDRFGSPVVPYAKLGLDCSLWRMAGSAEASTSGRTFGWHAAAGVTLDLSGLDPEAAREMDHESGINQTAVFFEVARYSLNGFGSGSSLYVGDLTWFAGVMLEF